MLEGRPTCALAVAVSGGADSLALALLAADCFPGAVTALIVDHGLRAESAAEAAQTQLWLSLKAIPAHVLRWAGAKPIANVQEAARVARYRLLEDWCVAHDTPALLTAHHQGDVAETFLMRLARGSGLSGLAAMPALAEPLTRSDGPKRLRPLLDIPKSRLIRTLELRGQPWNEDPSNHDGRFDRTAARRAVAQPAHPGLSQAALAAAALKLGEAEAALQSYVAALAAQWLSLDRFGVARLKAAALVQPIELRRRLLAQAIRCARGCWVDLDGDQLSRALAGVSGQERFTLAGVLVDPNDPLLFFREAGQCPPPVELPGGPLDLIWDHRFRLTHVDLPAGLTLAPLGEAGWRAVASAVSQHAAACPYPARLALPSFFHHQRPVFIPHLDYNVSGASSVVAAPLIPFLGSGPAPDDSSQGSGVVVVV
jgi:tRNA(Ile)-lysidine synthase